MVDVSIIMPAYNAERFIARAIKSVQTQTTRSWELIIVDDGSTDDTVAVVTAIPDERIRLYVQKHSGHPSVARNLALSHASGEFLTFLDADDIFSAERLHQCLSIMRAYSTCGVLFHDFDIIDAEDNIIRAGILSERGFADSPRLSLNPATSSLFSIESGLPSLMASEYVPLCTNTTMIRKSSFPLSEMRFREDVALAEDLDLWLRLTMAAPTMYLNERLSSYRKHGLGITSQQRRYLEDTLVVLSDHQSALRRACSRSERVALDRRLALLYRDLGYILLLENERGDARNAYAKAFSHLPTLGHLSGILKSCLPWAALRRRWRRIES